MDGLDPEHRTCVRATHVRTCVRVLFATHLWSFDLVSLNSRLESNKKKRRRVLSATHVRMLFSVQRLLGRRMERVYSATTVWFSGVRVSGSGLRVPGFGIRDVRRARAGTGALCHTGFRFSGFRVRVSGSGPRILVSRFRVQGSGLGASGSGFRVSGFWFLVSGFWFRAHGVPRS